MLYHCSMEYRQQIHYSLQARDAENELVPISIDQAIGILVWSPLPAAFCLASIAGTVKRRRELGTSIIGVNHRSTMRTSSSILLRFWSRSPMDAKPLPHKLR